MSDQNQNHGQNQSLGSRERILQHLRADRQPFESAPPRTTTPLAVTGPENDLVGRFKAEVEALLGKVYVVPDQESAIEAVLGIVESLGNVSAVMAWERLPLPGLTEALSTRQIASVSPRARGESRFAVLAEAEPLRVGITGADAAFATTGTMVMVTGEGHGRLASLLPPVHIALLARDRLFPRVEDWLASPQAMTALKSSSSISWITGPSRTSDIEMQTVRGVHGPGMVHVVLFG